MESPKPPVPPVLVSACLLGTRCRYDGRDALEPGLRAQLLGRAILAVCPEELASLSTPRPKAALSGGDGASVVEGSARVESETGEDLTPAFLEGARRTLEIAAAAGVEEAVLKERSPSCGSTRVRIGGELVAGSGVTAAVLSGAGIRVRSAG